MSNYFQLEDMAGNVTAESSNRASRVCARDNATVHVGNSFSPRTFHGGCHNHGSESDVTRDSVLRNLALHSYKERKNINPERVPNTCEWFISHPRYKQWRQHTSSSILRVLADPGCGKSVLAKFLVDEELESNTTTTTSYFFFKVGLGDQSSATMALRCIIHQILVQRPILFTDEILKKFRQASYLLTTTAELWDVIVKIGSYPKAGEMIIVLDAFDECSTAGRTELEMLMCAFYSKEKLKGNIKLILTSRPYEDVVNGFESKKVSDFPVLHLAGENEEDVRMIAGEIDLVIAARVEELAARRKLTPDDAESLRVLLRDFNNRTYLWVYLTLDVIEKTRKTTDGRISLSNIIQHLPESIYDAYENILIRSSDDVKTQKLLEIMMAATRPLTLAEMAEALQLEEHHSSHAEMRAGMESNMQKYLRDLGGLFIVVINCEVFFVHQTAREFLLRSSRDEIPKHSEGRGQHLPTPPRITSHTSSRSRKWAHTIEMQHAQRSMSQLCVAYLRLPDSSNDTDGSQQRSGMTEQGSAFAFLEYASQNWYVHCRKADFDGTTAQNILPLLGFPVVEETNCIRWMHESIKPDLRQLNPLMLASKLGLVPAVAELVKTHPKTVKKIHRTSGRSALSFAAEEGFDDIVKLLLPHCTNRLRRAFGIVNKHVDNSDMNGQTPLSFAALNSHTVVARDLLKAGARPDIKDGSQGTPTSYGLCSEDDQLVKLMLDRTTKSDQKLLDKSLVDILSFAILQGQSRVITRIISTRKVEATSICSFSPGLRAQRQNAIVIPELTLPYSGGHGEETQVSPNTVSQLAALEGEISFFEAFEAAGDSAVVRHRDDANGSSLLHWAAVGTESSGTMIKELLSRGVEVNTVDIIAGFTPLHWALWAQKYKNAALLLSNKACVQVGTRSAFKMGYWPHNALTFLNQDKDFFEPLRFSNHDRKILRKFVIDCSIFPPVAIKASRRYLQQIAKAKQAENWLKCHPDSKERKEAQHDMDFWLAKASNEKEFSPSLKAWEEAFHTQAGVGLSYMVAADAILRKRHDVLNCLLRGGLAGNVCDIQGRTLLHLLPHPMDASILIAKGADVNKKDLQGRTALHEAAWSGQVALVRLLLERHAEPAIQDLDGITPLQETLYAAIYQVGTVEEVRDILAILLDTRVGIDTPDMNGRGALHIAAERGLRDIARQLINGGASVGVRDAQGNTPLHFAYAKENQSVIDELLSAGADQTVQNNGGISARQYRFPPSNPMPPKSSAASQLREKLRFFRRTRQA